MYIVIVFLALMTSCFTMLCGNLIGRLGVIILTVGGLIMCFFLSLIIYYEVALTGLDCIVFLYKYLDIGNFYIDLTLYFDTITAVMLFTVCFISLCVHLYSVEYMGQDPGFLRFMAYISLFTFFMLFLVTADNLIQLFVGWEGVGLSSYLLISFWYTRVLANKAAIKAMLINKIGDLALFVAISTLILVFGSVKYLVMFNLISYVTIYNFIFCGIKLNIFNIICLGLIIGAMGKSAQLGLHIWLPDAMEGPTPVSALIHAATMVTAGVFLIIRCSFFFEHFFNYLILISLVGGLTCFLFAIVGAFQFDIKKIVAYSTCSQLGYMFFSSGMSNYHVSLFHLFNHALFKALLFLSMGSIIHAMLDEQDFRRMGGLVNLLPFTYSMVLVGNISLLGLPFLSGYYSKDMLLEFVYARYTLTGLFTYILGIFAAFFTAYYSMRLMYWVFFSKPNFYKRQLSLILEPGINMTFVLFVLSICSIFFGYIFNDSFIGVGSNFWKSSIFISVSNYSIFDAEFSLIWVKYMPLIFTFLGIGYFFISYFFIKENFKIFFDKFILKFLYNFFSKSILFDKIFVDILFVKILNFSYIYVYKYIEKGIFELFGPLYIYILILYYNLYIKKLNFGLFYFYFYISLSFIIIQVILMLSSIEFELEYIGVNCIFFILFFFNFNYKKKIKSYFYLRNV